MMITMIWCCDSHLFLRQVQRESKREEGSIVDVMWRHIISHHILPIHVGVRVVYTTNNLCWCCCCDSPAYRLRPSAIDFDRRTSTWCRSVPHNCVVVVVVVAVWFWSWSWLLMRFLLCFRWCWTTCMLVLYVSSRPLVLRVSLYLYMPVMSPFSLINWWLHTVRCSIVILPLITVCLARCYAAVAMFLICGISLLIRSIIFGGRVRRLQKVPCCETVRERERQSSLLPHSNCPPPPFLLLL